jgi:hypothetical protein
MKTISILLAAVAAQVFAANAAAQSRTDDIVVTAQRPEQVRAFVEQVSVASAVADQLPRWDDAICPAILGLSQSQGELIADQIARRSAALDLDPGAIGCAPNVFVFFAADSDAFAQALLRDRKGLLAYYHEENVVTLGQAALREFVDTPRPVRWWHVAHTLSADGERLSGDSAAVSAGPPPAEGQMRADPDGFAGVQAIRSSGSRLGGASSGRATRQDLNRVIIIVDGRRAAGVELAALADFIAMVALAQIDPHADLTGYPSILSLFDAAASGERRPTGLTAWDMAYLDGLYRANRAAQNARQQIREISAHIVGRSD